MSGKLKAGLLLVLFYGIGIASGMAWQRYRVQNWPKHSSMYAEHRVDRMRKALKLTDSQASALKEIFQKAHARADQVNEKVTWELAQIHRDSVEAIRAVLTPEQLTQFEK